MSRDIVLQGMASPGFSGAPRMTKVFYTLSGVPLSNLGCAAASVSVSTFQLFRIRPHDYMNKSPHLL